MAADSYDIQKNMKIYLSTATKTKWEKMIPILAEIGDIVQEFNNNDMAVRLEGKERIEKYSEKLSGQVRDLITKNNSNAAPIPPDSSLSKEDLQIKKDIVNCINRSAIMVRKILCGLQFALYNADNGAGACQELATVSFCLLMALYGQGHDRQLDLELVAAFMGEGSHALVVINRNQECDPKNVSAWGEDCLIFDPQHRILYSPGTIPVYAGLSAFLHQDIPPTNRIEVDFKNNLDLPVLAPWLEHEKFGVFVQESQKTIHGFCQERLRSFLKSRMFGLDAQSNTPGVFATSIGSKSSLIEYLETLSGLRFTGIKTKDWSTHHFADLPTESEEIKARHLQETLPGHGLVTFLSGRGKVLFFLNTNNDGGKAFRDDVLSVMRARRQVFP